MRSFRLVNDAGEIWPLDGEDGIYFLNPEGLGYNESVSAGKVVSGFSKKTHTEISWPNLTGTLYITKMCDAKSAVKRSSTDNSKDGVYDTYLKFTDFLINTKQLYFDYNPYHGTEGSEYARTEVALMSIDKSEIVEGDTLQCKMTLARLTPWYYEDLIVDGSGSSTTGFFSRLLTSSSRKGAKIDCCYRIEITSSDTIDAEIAKNTEFYFSIIDDTTYTPVTCSECRIKPFTGGSVVYSSKYNDVLVLQNGSNVMDKVDISKNILLRIDPNKYPDNKLRIFSGVYNPISTQQFDYRFSWKVYRYEYYRSV